MSHLLLMRGRKLDPCFVDVASLATSLLGGWRTKAEDAYLFMDMFLPYYSSVIVLLLSLFSLQLFSLHKDS